MGVSPEELSHGAAKWAASDPTAIPGVVGTMPPPPPAERFDVGIMTEPPVSTPNKLHRRFGARNGLDWRAGAKHGQLPRVPDAAMKSWREKLHVMQQDLYEKDAR